MANFFNYKKKRKKEASYISVDSGKLDPYFLEKMSSARTILEILAKKMFGGSYSPPPRSLVA